jgi:hypothetical protein
VRTCAWRSAKRAGYPAARRPAFRVFRDRPDKGNRRHEKGRHHVRPLFWDTVPALKRRKIGHERHVKTAGKRAGTRAGRKRDRRSGVRAGAAEPPRGGVIPNASDNTGLGFFQCAKYRRPKTPARRAGQGASSGHPDTGRRRDTAAARARPAAARSWHATSSEALIGGVSRGCRPGVTPPCHGSLSRGLTTHLTSHPPRRLTPPAPRERHATRAMRAELAARSTARREPGAGGARLRVAGLQDRTLAARGLWRPPVSAGGARHRRCTWRRLADRQVYFALSVTEKRRI